MIAQTFRSARIMIVDDEPAMVRLLEQLLERAGYTHLCGTSDPREVPTRYREFGPDLILLDLRMPHLDGVQVLERLKRETGTETYLPVLLLTADAAARARAQGIGDAAERCVRIVRSFLTMARRHPPERAHVSVNQVLKDAVELLAYELRVANVDVRVDLPDDLPLVWADGHQLRQVAVNLIANARQAMLDTPPPRRLSLAARSDDSSRSVRVEIADTGPGIPQEIQARIFEPFFTTKSEGEGTGLGLALTRGIIEGHGGTIRVENRPGHGACFLIELPVGAPPVGSDAPGTLDAAAPVVGKAILVVDDEPAVASILAEAWTRDGYTGDTALNGALALEKLEAQPYDLIISDSGMPVMNGLELYREVERREPRLARRFVVVTGDILNPRTREFLERIGAPRLEKPFTLDGVKRVVRRALLAHEPG